MSNTVINWRFGAWHFQVIRWGDWRAYIRDRLCPIRWSFNGYHAKGGPGRAQAWSPIAIYQGGWYLFALVSILALILLRWAL